MHFPEELWIRTLQFVEWDSKYDFRGYIDTLLSLSLVSRLGNDLSSPLLYKEIDIAKLAR